MTEPDRLPNVITPRNALMFASLTIFGAISYLYVAGFRSAYTAVFWVVGVDTTFKPYVPFVDFDEMLAVWQCHPLGVDVYLADPCDILGRPHAYSPVWFLGSFTGLGPADIGWIGSILVVAFLVTVALVSNPRTYGEAAVYLIALLSQSCMFAMERANIDLIMFMLIVGACVLYTRGGWNRIAAYVLIYVAAILKFYPIMALGLALYESKRRFLMIAAAATVGVAVFIVFAWHDLVESWPLIPRPGPFEDAFSGLNVLEIVQYFFIPGEPRVLGLYRVISPLLYVIAITLLVAGSLLRSPQMTAAMDGPLVPNLTSAMAFAGAAIIVCSFFVTKNVDYRGIWLLTILPALMHFRRGAAYRRFWTAAAVVVLALMWCECFHYHVMSSPEWVYLQVALFRKPLWWIFIFGLMTMLWAWVSTSPVTGGFVGYAQRRLAWIGAQSSPS